MYIPSDKPLSEQEWIEQRTIVEQNRKTIEGKPIVAPSALSPSSSAPSARRYAASELDRSARSSKNR